MRGCVLPETAKKLPPNRRCLAAPENAPVNTNPVETYLECSQKTLRGSACQALPPPGTRKTSSTDPKETLFHLLCCSDVLNLAETALSRRADFKVRAKGTFQTHFNIPTGRFCSRRSHRHKPMLVPNPSSE